MPRVVKNANSKKVVRKSYASNAVKASGKGAYSFSKSVGDIGEKVGAKAGGWLGRQALQRPAEWLGLGAYRRRVTGRGAYSIDDGVLAPAVPRFVNNGNDDSIVVSHREYIGDVYTSSSANTFSVQSFDINPGSNITFPWLSTIAQTSFCQYRFDGLMFEFVSTSSDALNSTNTALGAVVACINYDSNDPAYASRMQMENTSWANACKPSQNLIIPVECDPKMTAMQGLLYVSNNGVLPNTADITSYNLGKLSIATTGFQGTSINIGSIYVTYKCRLFKPAMLPPLSNANRTLLIRTGCTTAVPFGTATSTTLAVPAECDTLGVTFTATTITIPKKRLQNGQRFAMVAQFLHDSGAATCPTVGYSSNLDQFAAFGSAAATPVANPVFGFPNPVGATQVQCGFVTLFGINNDNADAVITLSAGTLPANCVLNVQIYQVCGIPSLQLGIAS